MLSKYTEILRNKGLRSTPQRIEILKYLDENRTHPTLDELYTHIKNIHPSVSKMTIYNVTDSLVKNNIISSMRFVHSTELRVDFDAGTHFHFVCKKCNNIFDIDSVIDIDKIVRKQGHHPDDYKVNIYGTCKKCLKNK